MDLDRWKWYCDGVDMEEDPKSRKALDEVEGPQTVQNVADKYGSLLGHCHENREMFS